MLNRAASLEQPHIFPISEQLKPSKANNKNRSRWVGVQVSRTLKISSNVSCWQAKSSGVY